MQITMQSTRLDWPAKTNLRMTLDCSRIAKEIAMMRGLLSRARDKNKNDQKNLPRKLVDYCPKQGTSNEP